MLKKQNKNKNKNRNKTKNDDETHPIHACDVLTGPINHVAFVPSLKNNNDDNQFIDMITRLYYIVECIKEGTRPDVPCHTTKIAMIP